MHELEHLDDRHLKAKATLANCFPILAHAANSQSIADRSINKTLVSQIQPALQITAHFDNASTSQKPQSVIDILANFYRFENANVHRGLYSLSAEATERFELAREKLASYVGVDPAHLIFTSGTTASLNLLARGCTQAISPGDVILLSVLEHHSNLLPWIQLADERGATIEMIPIHANGTLDLTHAKHVIDTKSVRIVSITGLSHVLGNATPYPELFSIAKARGALCFLDGAQMGLGLKDVMKTPHIDAVAFSGHKLHAPFGVGALAISAELKEKLKPVFSGGGMVASVGDSLKLEDIAWRECPHCFESGTPPVAEAIAFAEAIELIKTDLYQEASSLNWIESIARELARNPKVELYGWAKTRPSDSLPNTLPDSLPEAFADSSGNGSTPAHGSVLSFNLHSSRGTLHPHDVAQELADQEIHVRAGHHCAQPLMKHLGLASGTVRVSLAPTTSWNEVNHFLHVIKSLTGVEN